MTCPAGAAMRGSSWIAADTSSRVTKSSAMWWTTSVPLGKPTRFTASTWRVPTASSRTISRSEEHTSELQSPCNLVCRLLLEKKKKKEQNEMICNKEIECIREM